MMIRFTYKGRKKQKKVKKETGLYGKELIMDRGV